MSLKLLLHSHWETCSICQGAGYVSETSMELCRECQGEGRFIVSNPRVKAAESEE